MLIFPWLFIYILLMLHSSDKSLGLGASITEYNWSRHLNQKRTAILGKQLARQFESKCEPSKLSHCKYIHMWYFTFAYPGKPKKFKVCCPFRWWEIMMSNPKVKFLFPWLKLSITWKTNNFWIMSFSLN